MQASRFPSRWAPEWAYGISAPMWVSSPDRLLCEINCEAEALLGHKAQECLWKPCFEVVAGVDSRGRIFCRRDCPIRQKSSAGLGLEVHHLTTSRERGHLVPFHLLAIAVAGPDNRIPWLVHCAVEAYRCQRLRHYLTQVATRPLEISADFAPDNRQLTPREREILELMIEDHDMDQIAKDLHVSYHTVRNHVQHILPKLSAHSIQQAIAVYLLQERRPHS